MIYDKKNNGTSQEAIIDIDACDEAIIDCKII